MYHLLKKERDHLMQICKMKMKSYYIIINKWRNIVENNNFQA